MWLAELKRKWPGSKDTEMQGVEQVDWPYLQHLLPLIYEASERLRRRLGSG